MMLHIPTALISALRGFAGHSGYIGPGDLSDRVGVLHGRLALFAIAFILLRSIAVVLIATERGQKDLANLAHRDPLTNTLDRGGMAKAYAQARGDRCSTLLVDIDHFKQTHDTHGRAIGDDILMAFVGAATQMLSHSDLIGRHGGDEFIIVTTDRDQDQVGELAHLISATYAENLARINENLTSSLSIGVATVSDASMSLWLLTRRADQALYMAEQRGRDTVHSFEDFGDLQST